MRSLDPSRLGNQVWREGLTLIRGGWPNHPASKMWRGYEYQLGMYLLAGIRVLHERGKYYREIEQKILKEMRQFQKTDYPHWFGSDKLHASHRAALLYKNPTWYGKFGWKELPAIPDNKGSLNYWWPI